MLNIEILMQSNHLKRIAIFASGTGTNARNIIKFCSKEAQLNVALVVCNKAKAPVRAIAESEKIPELLINRNDFYHSESIINTLREHQIDLIVLAGFNWLLPIYLVKEFENQIINIHPSLLPKYGGKGMYGSNVHQAVIKAKDKVSGISIHFVNEAYDEGEILFQKEYVLKKKETAESLATQIHLLEYEYYPFVIKELLLNKKM